MKKNSAKKQLGIFGEKLVVDNLLKAGFSIVAQNYTQYFGEIDIIAQKGDLLSFIEVKTRHNPLFDMTELISYSKQKKIIATAKYYCARNKIVNLTCRFDVALVTSNTKNQLEVTIIENAFTESY